MPEAKENSVYELLASLIAALPRFQYPTLSLFRLEPVPFSCESHEHPVNPVSTGKNKKDYYRSHNLPERKASVLS